MENKILTIYTDGACLDNPGPGGWAAIIIYNGKAKSISGYEGATTNNRMEMMAAIKALSYIKEDSQSSIHLFTDSTYLKNGITTWIHNWKKNNWKTSSGMVKNIDLWKELDYHNSRHKVEWRWVKGHSGNKYNEMADQLAMRAITDVINR